MKPDIGSESLFLPTPPAFDAPVRGGGSRRNIAMSFGMKKKLEWYGIATRRWKNFEDMFILLDRIYERDGRTDRQTHGQTPHDG